MHAFHVSGIGTKEIDGGRRYWDEQPRQDKDDDHDSNIHVKHKPVVVVVVDRISSSFEGFVRPSCCTWKRWRRRTRQSRRKRTRQEPTRGRSQQRRQRVCWRK